MREGTDDRCGFEPLIGLPSDPQDFELARMANPGLERVFDREQDPDSFVCSVADCALRRSDVTTFMLDEEGLRHAKVVQRAGSICVLHRLQPPDPGRNLMR